MQAYLKNKLQKRYIKRFKLLTKYFIIFVPKKNGGLQLYINYRTVNKITIKNRYLLLLISKLINRLKITKIFFKLDLKNTYHHIRIRKNDE